MSKGEVENEVKSKVESKVKRRGESKSGESSEAQSGDRTGEPAALIQVDSETAETDSAFGDDGVGDDSLSTQSLYSHITNFVYENGRRYHSYQQGAYWGPNDEVAQDNLDLYHHLFTQTLGGKLFLAPIGPDPQKVLDLGTGTGIWAMDFADEFPSAAVIATDLSPIQPSMVPPNLQFEVDDMCLPWTFHPPASFDFIHARCIYGCVADYPALYAQVLEHLKPGAWFQHAEISVVAVADDKSLEGTHLDRWGPLALEAGVKFGKSFSIAEDMEGFMRNAGFVNVERHMFPWPIGTWAKDPEMKRIGAYNRLGWEEGLEGGGRKKFTF
ncbi:related to methyltransferase [Cephalotrichum gorgonifer]|uniref:Related to methyltransferase n=1 Tax=Cephalotrichum gorgonifer TaxID=2041049 RepID=A0AAE8N359_9PEZI|nr:related to methyltransferase [Cephalotrichum gorgonifer]